MENPRVVAIMLKNGRDEMTARAVRSFEFPDVPKQEATDLGHRGVYG